MSLSGGVGGSLGNVSAVEGVLASDDLVSWVLKEAVAFVQHLVWFFWPTEHIAALLSQYKAHL